MALLVATSFWPRPGRAGALALLLLLLPGGGCINTKPRPMAIPTCRLTQAQFVERCAALLTENGYQIITADPARGQVRAARGQRQAALGENMQYSGPYLFEATYPAQGGSATVLVAQTLRAVTSPDEKPTIMHTLNEGSNTSAADKKYFVPVLQALRTACQ